MSTIFYGRIRIDRIVKTGYRLQRFDVDRTIDIQPLATAVGFKCFFLSLLDPAVRGNAVMLRMGGIGKIDGSFSPLLVLMCSYSSRNACCWARSCLPGTCVGFL